MVSMRCSGKGVVGSFTGRRLPYSSYLPSHTSSVFILERG